MKGDFMNKNAKLELLMSFYKSHGLNLSWNQVEILQRLARRIQNNAVNLCNVPTFVDRREALENALKHKVGLDMSKVEVGGDPRGYCLKITCPDGREVCPEHFN